MDETPEEILARLIRYRDSLIRANQFPTPPSWSPAQSAIFGTLLGMVLSVVACVIALVTFAHLAFALALVIVAAMVALGILAATRRLPAALWWTAGAVIGGALGCLS